MKQARLKKFFSQEGLTNFWFKKDKANRTIFFPWGVFGKGRVIPNKSSEDKIRECVRFSGYCQTGTWIGGGATSTFTWYLLIATIVLSAILLAWYYFEVKKLVAGLPFSDTRLTFVEHYATYTAEWSSFTVWLLFVFSILCFVGLLALVVKDFWSGSPKVDSTGVLVAILFLLFLGGLAYIFGGVIRLRAGSRDQV